MFNKVLLIDDDELTNLLNKKSIQKANFANQIETVLNGQEALDYLQSCPPSEMPDLIFLDINMPIMNGFEFLEMFNRDFKNKCNSIVLMMLTTSLSEKDLHRSKENENVAEFISKPLTIDKLNDIKKKYI